MEFLRGIIQDIKTNREIAKERKEARRKQAALSNFFDSSAGERYLEDVLNELKIEKVIRKQILATDNEFKQFRLAVEVDEETFRKVVHERRPELIRYQITHQDDAIDAGNLLIEVNDKVAIETGGIIFPYTDAVKGILDDLPEVYISQVKDYSRYFQPWRELVLKTLDK